MSIDQLSRRNCYNVIFIKCNNVAHRYWFRISVKSTEKSSRSLHTCIVCFVSDENDGNLLIIILIGLTDDLFNSLHSMLTINGEDFLITTKFKNA